MFLAFLVHSFCNTTVASPTAGYKSFSVILSAVLHVAVWSVTSPDTLSFGLHFQFNVHSLIHQLLITYQQTQLCYLLNWTLCEWWMVSQKQLKEKNLTNKTQYMSINTSRQILLLICFKGLIYFFTVVFTSKRINVKQILF